MSRDRSTGPATSAPGRQVAGWSPVSSGAPASTTSRPASVARRVVPEASSSDLGAGLDHGHPGSRQALALAVEAGARQ